jgi:hypothetical protein
VHIYIDESGPFVPTTEPRVSCVAALAIPSAKRDGLFRDFDRLKKEISGSKEELKGSTLTERQTRRVARLLGACDATLELVLIDMGRQRDEETSASKFEQASGITEHLTRDHYKMQVEELLYCQQAMRSVSNQLYVQMRLTIGIVRRGFEIFTNYYAQREPAELGSFEWIVDAKQADRLTPSEALWSTLLLPMMNLTRVAHFGWADYSHMDRFRTSISIQEAPALDGYDLHGVIGEGLSFRDSRDEPGLQLADIAANAVTRAMNWRLASEGWLDFGRLIVARREQTIELAALDDTAGPIIKPSSIAYQPVFGPRLLALQSMAKPMLKIPDGYTEDSAAIIANRNRQPRLRADW